MSAAVATMLQVGLLPLVSRETGISLETGVGAYLETCSVEEVGRAASTVHGLTEAVLREQISSAQARALREYSRPHFSSAMRGYLTDVLGSRA
jgi:hypothetical protein